MHYKNSFGMFLRNKKNRTAKEECYFVIVYLEFFQNTAIVWEMYFCMILLIAYLAARVASTWE